MAFEEVQHLAVELDVLQHTAESQGDVALRQKVLDFIKNVCDEADKAFGDIDSVLSRISSLPSGVPEVAVMSLHQDLVDTYSRDKFKKVQKICDRLDELGRQFNEDIKPQLGTAYANRASELFWLLEKGEGRFIETIRNALDSLSHQLVAYRAGAEVVPIRQAASTVQAKLRNAMAEMQRIRVGAEAMEPGGARRLLEWEGVANEVLRRNPWFSGTFYVAVLAGLLAVLTWISGRLDVVRLIFVVTAALAGLTLVGALQLRNDNRLSEAGFLRLIDLSLRRVFLPIARPVRRR